MTSGTNEPHIIGFGKLAVCLARAPGPDRPDRPGIANGFGNRPCLGVARHRLG